MILFFFPMYSRIPTSQTLSFFNFWQFKQTWLPFTHMHAEVILVIFSLHLKSYRNRLGAHVRRHYFSGGGEEWQLEIWWSWKIRVRKQGKLLTSEQDEKCFTFFTVFFLPQHVLEQLIPAFGHKAWRVREEVLHCLVTSLNEWVGALLRTLLFEKL